MKPLIEVCVRRHCCYNKEIPWQWDDGTNGLLTPLSGMALRAIPSSCGFNYQRVNRRYSMSQQDVTKTYENNVE